MRNYPHWPDSAVVSRRWNECRIKGYIVGGAAEGFKLTARGIKFAERVSKKLGVATAKPAQVTKVHSPKKVTKTRVIQSNKTGAVRPKKTHPSIQVSRVKTAPPVRSDKAHTPVQVDKARPPKIHPIKSDKVRQPVQVVKVQPKQADKVRPTPFSVPKEVKIRAGKFVRVMETSDAYIHYRKNGKNSRIGEFDFRSLLLCTMESSRETLVKNVELFKGYASMHNRRDLLIFLNHCEDRFSYLLVAPQKQLKKPIRKSTK